MQRIIRRLAAFNITLFMSCILLLPSLSMGAPSALAGTPQAEARDWVLITDKDGVKVYRAHTDDSPIKTFRGETDVSLEDFRSIGAIMDDYDFVSSWLHMVSEIEGFKRPSPHRREVWLTTRLPWPVADRDVVLEVLMEQDLETYTVRMPFRQVVRIPDKDKYVRVPRMDGYLEFAPIEPGRIHLTIEVILDPGGRLPAWLANLILRDIPYFSLKSFRNVANTERYQGVDLGYFDVPPGWPGNNNEMPAVAAAK